MVTLILALCIPVTAFVTGFFVIQGVKVGMGKDEPKIVYKEPEQPQVQEEKTKEVNEQVASIMNEWLNGAPKAGE